MPSRPSAFQALRPARPFGPVPGSSPGWLGFSVRHLEKWIDLVTQARRRGPNNLTDAVGEMAGEGQRITCLGCRREFGGGEATVEDNFDCNKQGEPYSRCRPCKAKHSEAQKAFYYRNQETSRAWTKAYKEAHREEINRNAAEKVVCELCGRMASRSHIKRHQASHLCEKNRPAP